MAEEIGKGAEWLGLKVEMKRVEECGLNDLPEADIQFKGVRGWIAQGECHQ